MALETNGTPSTEISLSDRQSRAIAARDGIEGGSRPAALVPRTFLEAQAFCGALATSDLIPMKLKDRAADVLVIVLAGIELGLPPMQSIRLYHVMDGVPRLSADGIASIVLASPQCVYLECTESTETRCTWVTQRRGRPERSCTWTIERAKRAGLPDRKNRDGSANNWVKYPENMLSARAKAELCRMVYPDIAAGLVSREEALDGASDVWVEFREVGPAPSFVAPAPQVVDAAGTPAAVPANDAPVKRGPGRPPKERPAQVIDTTATTAAPVEPSPIEAPATKLDAAITKVEQKAAPAPEPAPAPPARVDEAFGDEDPIDAEPPKKSAAGFLAWLASCKTRTELDARKSEWVEWSKVTYEQNSDGAKAMRTAWAKRSAEVPA